MMIKINKIFAACLVSCNIVAALTSCGDDEAPIADLTPAYCPSSIEFQLPEQLQQLIYQDETGASVLPLLKGETAALAYTMEPEDATFKEVQWTSSNPEIAAVDDNGTVTALSSAGLGYSIVSVAPTGMFSGSGVNCNLKVKVSDVLVKAQGVNVEASATEVYAGETIQMTATILPAEATYRTVRWISSNEQAATVDINGVVTGRVTSSNTTNVTITATTLAGSNISGSVDIVVKQIVQPQRIELDQTFAAPAYLCAIGEKYVKLSYTTYPEDCTRSLIQWSSSDENIATVEDGVVTFNEAGNFGDFTITARCPETGNESSVKMSMPAGLIRELFHDPDNYSWWNAKQSGNGSESSHEWHYGYLTVTTYNQNATNQRGDFRCWNTKTYIHAGNYPLFAIKMEDARDLYEEITSVAINLDTSGDVDGTKYSGNVGGSNNKWAHDYKCADGSHVYVYDFATQNFATGGLLPKDKVGAFSTFQIKYADMRTISHQIQYRVYWVQTFKTLDDITDYLKSEGIEYEQVK